LLVRCGTAFKLTSVAEELVEPIRSALLQMDAALDLQPHFDVANSARHFRVMATDYMSVILLSPALRAAASIARGLSFTVVPFAKAPHEALERGDVDLLIIADNLVSSDEPFEALFEDEYVCVCASENEAANDGMPVERFLSLGHVVCRYGNGAIPYIEEQFFRTAGYDRRIEVYASSFGEVPHYLVGTDRVAITHRKLAEIFSRTMPLRFFAPPVPMPLVKHAAQWHSYRHKDPAIEWLRALLQEVAAEVARR
jgi:DNA-binding transcriptional LysR family regulator